MNKNFFILVLVLCVGIWALVSYKACSEKRIIAGYNSHIIDYKDTALLYKDLYGKTHLKAKNLEVENILLEKKLNEISKELKIKPKNIERVKGLTTKTVIQFVHDTIPSYDTAYLTFIKRNDSTTIILNDTLQIVDYWKRSWFLGEKRYYVDVKNVNPYVNLKSLVGYKIKMKPTRFIIGPYAGYNLLTNTPSLGIGVIYYPASIRIKF